MPNPFLVLGCDESNFLGLVDTPDSYVGQGGKFLRVKATEDGIEFVAGGTWITDELVKVSVGDTTAGFLGSKLQAGSNITLTVLNVGGDERLEIKSNQINDTTLSTALTWSSQKISSELSAKADKVLGATAGNFASLDASGNIGDSGYSASSFSLASHSHNLGDLGDVDTTGAAVGQVLEFDGALWRPVNPSGGGRNLLASVDVASQVSSVSLTGLNLTADKDYELVVEAVLSASNTIVSEGSIFVNINGQSGSVYGKYERLYHVSSNVWAFGGSGILLGFIRNAVGSRGIILTRLKLVVDKPFFYSINLPDVSGNYNSVSNIVCNFNLSMPAITDLELYIGNGEFFAAGTKIRLYEI